MPNPSPEPKEPDAFLSLSRTQRRLAHQYRRWALEDAAAGNLDRYRKNRAEAERLWKSAKFHLRRACERLRKPMEFHHAA